MKKFLKMVLIFFILFSLAIGGGVAYYLKIDNERSKENSIEQLDEKNYKERINILLLGVDSLDAANEKVATRTDTMMILSMDPKTDTAFVLSIPRDSRVKIPGRENYDKINHAHAYGGVELSVESVKQLLNIPIHHYVRVDYNALFKTVDDVGGVEIYVPQDMKYDDPWADPPLHIDLKEGLQTLDAEKSMQFLRFREGYANKDLGRIDAQQMFLDALIQKVLSPSSITKIPAYIETMYTYVNTDMSKLDMLSLARLAMGLDPNKIEMQTLVGKADYINGISYYIVDEEKMPEQLEYLLSGNYIIEETEELPQTTQEGNVEVNTEEKTVQTATSIVDGIESNVSVVVYNGSGYPNVARRATDLLKINDITVTSTGNASNFDYEETYIYYKSNFELAKEVRSSLGVGKIFEGTSRVDYREPDIVIILGKDFKNG